MGKVENAFEQYRNLTDRKLKVLGETVGSVWNNQAELAKSETRLDEQFCVLGRLAIMNINDLVLRAEGDDLISYEQVNAMFMEWEKFRSRSDFRDHMKSWFMGEDLSLLPEPPKEEKAPEAPAAESGDEEPQEFGGDYGQPREASGDGDPSDQQGEPKTSTDGSPDSVPEGRDDDKATREASALP